MKHFLLGIKIWFKDKSIKKKIMITYIPLIIIPIFLLLYLSNYFYTKSIVKKTIKNVSDDSQLVVTRIESIITNAEICANITTLDLNRNVYKTESNFSNRISELDLRNSIQNQLSLSLLIFKDIESMAFIDDRNNLYYPNSSLEYIKFENEYEKALKSKLLQNISESNGQSKWFTMGKREFLTLDNKENILTLGKKIINIRTGKELGILVLNIKEKYLSSSYQNIGPEKQRDYYIVDNNGMIVSAMDKQKILNTISDSPLKKDILADENITKVTSIDGNETLITSVPFTKMGWHLVAQIPLNKLTEDTRIVTVMIFFIGIVCIILGLLGAILLSKLIANPLVKLSKIMGKTREGNLYSRLNISSADEVGVLASSFDNMIMRIEELLVNIRFEQQKKREYELALIQAQIKPHFLYNTLDVIYKLSKMHKENEVQLATKALADFYRSALSNGKEIVTIQEELKNVSAYLAIQQIRYSDIFEYEIRVEEDILQFSILKLTIQPLIENAIYHGLKYRGSLGKIVIEGCRSEDKICIKIEDNGVGMSDERVEEILQQGSKEDIGDNSFGLNSVDKRIRLYFGNEYGIRINSEMGKGTQVIITIPDKLEGQSYVSR